MFDIEFYYACAIYLPNYDIKNYHCFITFDVYCDQNVWRQNDKASDIAHVWPFYDHRKLEQIRFNKDKNMFAQFLLQFYNYIKLKTFY